MAQGVAFAVANVAWAGAQLAGAAGGGVLADAAGDAAAFAAIGALAAVTLVGVVRFRAAGVGRRARSRSCTLDEEAKPELQC